MNKMSTRLEKGNTLHRFSLSVALLGLTLLILPASAADAGQAEMTVDSDLTIPLRDMSATAIFYPVQIDGNIAVFFAVKAPDNSVRVVVDACQACGSAGFRQEGEYFVCKSCEQKFHVSSLERKKGGCNPIPVGDANKVIGADSITLKKGFLKKVTTSKFAKQQ